MKIREIYPHSVKFMVNPLPVKDRAGKTKKDRKGRVVYRSANHIERRGSDTLVIPHPESFLFVVTEK